MLRLIITLSVLFSQGFLETVFAQDAPDRDQINSHGRPTDRGTVILGGAISLGHVDNADTKSSQLLSASPRALYFAAPGFAFGGEVVLSGSWRSGQGTFTYGLGPEIAFYFDDGSHPTYPFFKLSSTYTFSELAPRFGRHELGLGVEPGIAFFVAKNVSISTGLDIRVTWSRVSGPTLERAWSKGTYSLFLVSGIDAFIF